MSYRKSAGSEPALFEPVLSAAAAEKSGPNLDCWIVLVRSAAWSALGLLACCGGIGYLGQPPTASAAAKEPFTLCGRADAGVSRPRGARRARAGRDVAADFARRRRRLLRPARPRRLAVSLSAAGRAPASASLPCILICGAGSTLLRGMGLGEGDQPEHTALRSARAMRCVAYELDGPDTSEGDPASMQRAFKAFSDSRAGLVNARNALEYVLAKVPEVNPNQIYAAGHSSAATHALLFAEHEPRLAGVIAYAPAVDLPERFDNQMGLRAAVAHRAGLGRFRHAERPRHAPWRDLKSPTLLFHAEDDGNLSPSSRTKKFADAAAAARHGGDLDHRADGRPLRVDDRRRHSRRHPLAADAREVARRIRS